MNFTPADRALFKQKHISEDTVMYQLECFRKGFPFVQLNRPCTSNDGILIWSPDDLDRLLEVYEAEVHEADFLKFVPASGAASRMFKHLFNYKNGEKDELVSEFMRNLDRFAFYPELSEKAQSNQLDLDTLLKQKDFEAIINLLLSDQGLQYGILPKGLIDFHEYNHEVRKAVGEHLIESAAYAQGDDKQVRLHFTISESHKNKFKEYLKTLQNKVSKQLGCGFEIEFSVQSPSTDTIAVDMENEPFRLEDGTILFRPGGHGALIANLNQLDADVIFIKNIDNVVPERLQETTVIYKKALAAKLLELKAQRDYFLSALEQKKEVDQEQLLNLCRQLNMDSDGVEKASEFYELLDRPMRICGMVKNQGEPGGGPFWVNLEDGKVGLQIVEKAQIDLNNEAQKAILDESTHFNPVDLVCATKNHKGKRYDLTQFTDPNTGFIAEKSLEGRQLKAQELPGLWNGGMARWITLFVEVPLVTFNPVKTVNDLLKPNHQPA